MLIDVRAAVQELKRAGQSKVAVVGYCMGGSVAWLSATRIDGLAAAVGYYGGAVSEFAEEQPRCPAMLHFGETDASIPREHWEKVMKLHPKLPVYVYAGAGHGFNCDQRASYHEASARLARERTIEFLRKHLG
jgi:carboxymethylenebutenolidase